MPKVRDNKTDINFMIFLIFVENCLKLYSLHNFAVWLRTGSNPAGINRLQIHTGNSFTTKMIQEIIEELVLHK